MSEGAYTTRREGAAAWAVPGAIALLLLFGITLLHAMPQPADRDVTAVFAPGTSFAEALAGIHAAGGELLSVGASENIIIARFEDGWTHDTLADAGVWLVLSASFNSACLSNTRRRQTPLSQPI